MANKTAKLGDLATYINGYAFKPADWGDTGLPIIRIQDLTGNSYQLNRYDGEYPERIEVNDGDVLISWSASLGVYVWQRGKALLNQHIFKVVFDKLPVNKDYFVFAVEHKLAEMESKTHGATMKHIVKKDFDGTIIPYPPIEKQAEIADHLRRITSLIDRQTEQLLLLDQLVKSRFIELFGDPERNPKKWPVVSITEIIRGKVSNGFFAKRDAYRNDGNVQVLGVANIVNRMYSNIEGLPRTNATQAEKEKYRVEYGDMLFCRSSLVAEGIGKASIVPQDTPQNVLFECHVIRLPLDLQKCVPEFVQVLSTTPYFRKQIIAQSKTATMTTIGQDGILKAAIILPPVELQQEFLHFVEQTDKSKYYSSLSFRYCQAAANTYRQEWMTCRTSDF